MKNKVCIIGYNYSHKVLRNSFLVSRKFNIVAMSGKSKRQNIQKNSFKYYRSWKKMILEMKPDIVAIGIPPKEQEKVILFLLKKNINFLCEKPITNDNKKLSLFLKLSHKRKNCKRLIDLNFITIPAIQKFKKIVSKNKLSKDAKIEVKWFFKPRSLKNKSSWKNKKNELGDEINNFFFHLVSIIEFIFGDFNIILDYKKNHFFKFIFKNKKISFIVNFWSRSDKNLLNINFVKNNKSIKLTNYSKDYHNNYAIYKNNIKIYSKNFNKNTSRIMASKKIIDIFLGKHKHLEKFLGFENGLKIQKKINKFI